MHIVIFFANLDHLGVCIKCIMPTSAVWNKAFSVARILIVTALCYMDAINCLVLVAPLVSFQGHNVRSPDPGHVSPVH